MSLLLLTLQQLHLSRRARRVSYCAGADLGDKSWAKALAEAAMSKQALRKTSLDGEPKPAAGGGQQAET